MSSPGPGGATLAKPVGPAALRVTRLVEHCDLVGVQLVVDGPEHVDGVVAARTIEREIVVHGDDRHLTDRVLHDLAGVDVGFGEAREATLASLTPILDSDDEATRTRERQQVAAVIGGGEHVRGGLDARQP